MLLLRGMPHPRGRRIGCLRVRSSLYRGDGSGGEGLPRRGVDVRLRAGEEEAQLYR
jgi:hypothetical protein